MSMDSRTGTSLHQAALFERFSDLVANQETRKQLKVKLYFTHAILDAIALPFDNHVNIMTIQIEDVDDEVNCVKFSF